MIVTTGLETSVGTYFGHNQGLLFTHLSFFVFPKNLQIRQALLSLSRLYYITNWVLFRIGRPIYQVRPIFLFKTDSE